MDFSPPAATVFREIGGLSDMIDRLKLEVQAAPVAGPPETESSGEAMQTDAAPGSSNPAGAALRFADDLLAECGAPCTRAGIQVR